MTDGETEFEASGKRTLHDVLGEHAESGPIMVTIRKKRGAGRRYSLIIRKVVIDSSRKTGKD